MYIEHVVCLTYRVQSFKVSGMHMAIYVSIQITLGQKFDLVGGG